MNFEKIVFTQEDVLFEKIKLVNRILDNPNNLDVITKELFEEILECKENEINNLHTQLFAQELHLAELQKEELERKINNKSFKIGTENLHWNKQFLRDNI